MFSRNLLSTVLLAALSCGLSFQTQAVDLANGNFETNDLKNPHIGSSYDDAVDGWETDGFVFQMTKPFGFYDAVADLYYKSIEAPNGGDSFAMVVNYLFSDFVQRSELTSSEFNVNGPADVIFDMFLYSDSTDDLTDGFGEVFLLKKEGSSWISQAPLMHTTLDQPGFLNGSQTNNVWNPWVEKTLSFNGSGTYKLVFAVGYNDPDLTFASAGTFFGVDNVRVVPVPAAAWTGLALLGLFPLRRKLMGR